MINDINFMIEINIILKNFKQTLNNY